MRERFNEIDGSMKAGKTDYESRITEYLKQMNDLETDKAELQKQCNELKTKNMEDQKLHEDQTDQLRREFKKQSEEMKSRISDLES